ncbi:hypothetical protein Droror1_Dr00005054 [Drosera rotundifolia]
MKAFMLCRTKAKLIECGSLLLPPLTEITVMLPLVALQKKVYMSILRKELPKLLDFAAGTSSVSLQNIVIQLRKTCSHPYLFPCIEPEPYEEGEHLVQASGKLIFLDQLLQKLHNSGHRVLLFAQMTHTLDILQDYLELRRYTYERLDGSIRVEERFAAIRSFSSSQLLGMAIFYEQDWNPQVDKQALQRAHRIGQLKHVLSISLVTGHTVEEVIMRRAQRKLQLSQNVVGDDAIDVGGNGVSGAESTDLTSRLRCYIRSCCVDDSGTWGHGGMFDALVKLSDRIPEAYERASRFKDLHLGDLHIIQMDDDEMQGMDSPPPKWVALAVVQSYNPRRKVPRNNVSIPDLKRCISKAAFSAAQHSASIHMPRIGYRDRSDRAVWYTIERLLGKYASIYGIRIFVYYYRRG